ncbi:MAG: YbdD/YjiX family protein [Dermatophilaceae bacterium]
MTTSSDVTLAARITRAAKVVRWYARGVVGADAYERYLEHHARSGCEVPPMTEREFWRDKTDRQERNPTSRCC